MKTRVCLVKHLLKCLVKILSKICVELSIEKDMYITLNKNMCI